MRFYSPVGRGVSLLRAQGSISYVQSDKETYDMDDWIEKLASQYGAKQAAALRGDETTFKAADMWLASIAEHHWHEIIFAIRLVKNSQYVNRCPHEWYQGRCIHCDVKAVNGRPEQPDKVPASKIADDCGGPAKVIEGIAGKP